jgi:hypothetical protein
MTQNAVAVAGWVWTTTTVVGSVVAVALVAILSVDLFAGAISRGDGQRSWPHWKGERRLMGVAIPLAACFVAIVIVRFALIVAEHPGPQR